MILSNFWKEKDRRPRSRWKIEVGEDIGKLKIVNCNKKVRDNKLRKNISTHMSARGAKFCIILVTI